MTTATFPVVGVGASAGGLEALKQLFSHLPAEADMAFVVIQHLDPDRPSLLTRLLSGFTRLSVVEATSGMRLSPGRVHVIPPGSDLRVRDGILMLSARQKTDGLHLPIDAFFRSLAEDAPDGTVAIVLSGSGADGTEGLRAIKASGGIAMAQAPDSAQFRGMPESAIAAGVVDFRGTPEELAAELVRLSHHPYIAAASGAESGTGEPGLSDEARLAPVIAALRQHSGIDFGGYKRTTVLRRIERRMALRRLVSFGGYASSLRDDPTEARALAQDMLIHVTSFFRDPDAFVALKEHALKEIVDRTESGGSIRIWIPGCSTGEEAYALVICLLESLDERTNDVSVKVFGSDLSEESVASARLGVYPEQALVDVSPGRLARFFERVEGGYRIGKRVRDLCVFVKHDLIRDPPFAKLDLISCRNVLIYFDAELQRSVLPMLHYCLNSAGFLFLGQSETISGFRDLFAPVDKDHRIFVKTGGSSKLAYRVPVRGQAEVKPFEALRTDRRHPAREAQSQADHLLLARFAPPGVLVNERLEIIQFRGRTGAYLESPPGQPQANVLRMAREGLAAHLHEAIERVKAQSVTVRKDGLRIETPGGTEVVDLEVVPLATAPGSTERYFLVLFERPEPHAAEIERPSSRVREAAQAAAVTDSELDRLRAELGATREYLQSLIYDQQSTTDELGATNEELVAANEELQSTNEELQSAKEELQSTNEELSTLNDQLRGRNQELDLIANDLVNVLSSVDIPVIIVDLDLRVRRFTPTVINMASFIPEDLGRPIEDIKLKVRVDDLGAKIKDVIGGLSPKEWEVCGQDGRWFRMQIRPYLTADNRLDGAVLSFVDVDALRSAIEDAERARDYARSIVETVTAALVVLGPDMRVVSANEAFYELVAGSPSLVEGTSVFELAASVFQVPALRQALEQARATQARFTALELTAQLPRLGQRSLSLTGRPIVWGGGAHMFLLAIDDVTELRTLEAERARILESERLSRLEAERANSAKDLFLATLSHELRTPLSTLLMSSQILRQVAGADVRIERVSASIERSAKAQARLIDDLLDVSRIISGKLSLDLGPVDLAAVVQDAVDVARPSAQAKSLELEADIAGTIGAVFGDPARLWQVVSNLLANAIKFTPRGGRISVRLEPRGGRAELTVADTGMGIPPEFLPHLFDRFVQADSSVTRTYGGLGLGLSIVRHLVEAHGGEVRAESQGEGKGATFRVILPVGEAGASIPATRPRAAVRSIEGVRVLLVEDDDDTRDTYATMLAELGAEVRVADSGTAALTMLEAFRPDVILSDIAMPQEDGFSYIRRIRSLAPEHGGDVPAAAITALASDEDRRRAIESGFQVHLAKPVDSTQLAAVVGALADSKRRVPE